MAILDDFDEHDFSAIWSASDGNDYAVQFRREGERSWTCSEIALSKQTAIDWFRGAMQNPAYGVEYRVVRLSRYPPCPVTQIVSYFKEKE